MAISASLTHEYELSNVNTLADDYCHRHHHSDESSDKNGLLEPNNTTEDPEEEIDVRIQHRFQALQSNTMSSIHSVTPNVTSSYTPSVKVQPQLASAGNGIVTLRRTNTCDMELQAPNTNTTPEADDATNLLSTAPQVPPTEPTALPLSDCTASATECETKACLHKLFSTSGISWLTYIFITPMTIFLGGGLVLGLQEETKQRHNSKEEKCTYRESASKSLLSGEFFFSTSNGLTLIFSVCVTLILALQRAGSASQVQMWLISFLTVMLAVVGMSLFTVSQTVSSFLNGFGSTLLSFLVFLGMLLDKKGVMKRKVEHLA